MTCPVCDGPSTLLVPRGALPAGAAVLRCGACHVDFLDTPRPDRYWDTPGQEDIYEDDAVAREREASFRVILERIAKYVPAGSLLDIGAGKGEFAIEAARAGWHVSVLEPSERATRGIGSKGIAAIHNCSLEDFEPPKAYDCVTVLDVIEHTVNPLATLRAAALCLRPGGLLVLLTPDGGSMLRSAVVGASRLMSAFRGALKYQYYYPHLCYVSRKGFAALAEKSGLEVVSMQRTATPKRFLMAKLAHHYAKYPGNGAFACVVRVAYPLTRLCLGNKLLVFARKTR